MKTQQQLQNIAQNTTDGSLVPAVPGKTIRVLAFFLSAGATTTGFTFNGKLGAAAGVAISSLISLGVNSPFCSTHNPDGWFDCPQGAALTATTGAGSTVGVQVVYELR